MKGVTIYIFQLGSLENEQSHPLFTCIIELPEVLVRVPAKEICSSFPRCASFDPSRDDCVKNLPIMSPAAIYDPITLTKTIVSSDICPFSALNKTRISPPAQGEKVFHALEVIAIVANARESGQVMRCNGAAISFFPSSHRTQHIHKPLRYTRILPFRMSL